MNAFAQNLLEWYNPKNRNLPWKKTKDAYKIWLSEIIMQQTRVEQGTPYYLKFVEQYPSIKDLANAPLDDILKLETCQEVEQYLQERYEKLISEISL